jgi:hypothetical protein
MDIAPVTPSRTKFSVPGPPGVIDEALDQAMAVLPTIPEGIVTLGMMDIAEPVDEGYLLPAKPSLGPAQSLLGVARRPTEWIARSLRENGAMVASQITIGYFGVVVAHISRRCPGLCSRSVRLNNDAMTAGAETRIPHVIQRGLPTAVSRSLGWHPPSLLQRALCVRHCGWGGLRTAQSVARIGTIVLRGGTVAPTPYAETHAERAEAWSGRDAAVLTAAMDQLVRGYR